MSVLSFKVFCVEHYSHHISKPSDEVYQIFEKTGLLDLLESDYDDLHGMGMEYLMHFIDKYLEVNK